MQLSLEYEMKSIISVCMNISKALFLTLLNNFLGSFPRLDLYLITPLVNVFLKIYS